MSEGTIGTSSESTSSTTFIKSGEDVEVRDTASNSSQNDLETPALENSTILVSATAIGAKGDPFNFLKNHFVTNEEQNEPDLTALNWTYYQERNMLVSNLEFHKTIYDTKSNRR